MTSNFIVREVTWDDAKDQLTEIREKVFVYEQRVAPEIELDGLDPDCFHILVSTLEGAPVGTGRMTPQGKIGRVSVLLPYRGLGLGSKILQALVQIAEREKINLVKLHAQIQALDFYRRHKFEETGPVFMEAGIPHQSMKRCLF
jgi:predicted GNAT family N-acyltransferase